MLSWKQRCSIFDIHSNIHPYCDQFYKEMLIFYFVIDRNWNKTTHKVINKSYMLENKLK